MYCTVEDIEQYFLGKSFQCGDYLTNGKAKEFIICDAALIDASLRSRYSLPITNTGDLRILKIINEKMVVGTIDDIFREKTEDGQFERSRGMRKDALAMLKQIKNGELVLNSAGLTSPIKFNSTDSDGNDMEYRFKNSNIDKY